MKKEMRLAFEKILITIHSCKKVDQLSACRKMIRYYRRLYYEDECCQSDFEILVSVCTRKNFELVKKMPR